MTKSNASPIPVHPLLIGLYPALTLYYLNIQEIQLAAIWRAALPTSFTLLLIFTYGHFNTCFGGSYEMLPDVSKYSEIKNGKREIYKVPSSCAQ